MIYVIGVINSCPSSQLHQLLWYFSSWIVNSIANVFVYGFSCVVTGSGVKVDSNCYLECLHNIYSFYLFKLCVYQSRYLLSCAGWFFSLNMFSQHFRSYDYISNFLTGPMRVRNSECWQHKKKLCRKTVIYPADFSINRRIGTRM